MALLDQLSEGEKKEMLARCEDAPSSILLLEMMRAMYDKETEAIVKGGKICDEDFTQDFRFHLGMAAGMRRLLKDVKEAKETMLGR